MYQEKKYQTEEIRVIEKKEQKINFTLKRQYKNRPAYEINYLDMNHN